MPGVAAMVDWNAAVQSSAPVTFNVSIPTSGTAGTAVNCTIGATGSATDTFTFSDAGGGGTFNPATLTTSTFPASFAYTPGSAGSKTLTVTAQSGTAISGQPQTMVVTTVTPAAYTVSIPATGVVGTPATITITATGTTGTETFTFSDGGAGGTFAPASLTTSTFPAHVQYTPAATGTAAITVSAQSGTTVSGSGGSMAITTPGGAVTFTLTVPATSVVGVASACSITASGTGTDSFAFSDGGGGGTFTPTSLTTGTFPASFAYTPGSAGTKSITVTAQSGALVLGSPASTAASQPVSGTYVWTVPATAIVGVPITCTLTQSTGSKTNGQG
jgi:hypothetical protein